MSETRYWAIANRKKRACSCGHVDPYYTKTLRPHTAADPHTLAVIDDPEGWGAECLVPLAEIPADEYEGVYNLSAELRAGATYDDEDGAR